MLLCNRQTVAQWQSGRDANTHTVGIGTEEEQHHGDTFKNQIAAKQPVRERPAIEHVDACITPRRFQFAQVNQRRTSQTDRRCQMQWR